MQAIFTQLLIWQEVLELHSAAFILPGACCLSCHTLIESSYTFLFWQNNFRGPDNQVLSDPLWPLYWGIFSLYLTCILTGYSQAAYTCLWMPSVYHTDGIINMKDTGRLNRFSSPTTQMTVNTQPGIVILGKHCQNSKTFWIFLQTIYIEWV